LSQPALLNTRPGRRYTATLAGVLCSDEFDGGTILRRTGRNSCYGNTQQSLVRASSMLGLAHPDVLPELVDKLQRLRAASK